MALTPWVHAFRDGTGKSNISANLATLMALEGKCMGDISCVCRKKPGDGVR